MQAAFRSAGGGWLAPETISSPGESAEEQSVAFDARGDAFAVWDGYSANVPEGGAHFGIQAAFRPAGGSWQAPVDLSPVQAPGSGHPQLAVDERGDAIAIWSRFGGPVQEAFKPAGGAWQAPVDVTGESGDEPQVVLDGQGDALAVWDDWAGVESAFMPVGGSWQAPVQVAGPGLAGGLQIASNEQGNATAIWDQWTNGFLSPRSVQSAFKPAGGAWQAAVDIVGKRYEDVQPIDAEDPHIAIDGQGDEMAVWVWELGHNVQAAFRPAGGMWQEPTELSVFEGSASDPDVAFDDRGDALAAWSSKPTVYSSNIVQSAFKPAGGEWQAPVDLSGETLSAYAPQIAFDEQGDAIAAWTDEPGIQVAGYAATGPSLRNVSIPSEGKVGQPVAFSVSPFDVWSIGGETSWSFGDGSSASGTSVTHTYTTAGTYEVTIHSADALDNVTSTTGKVTIAPAPPTTTPSPSAPTPAGPDTSTVTTPLVTLMASEFVVAGSSAQVRVECQAAACRGSIELTVQVPESGKGKTAADHKATLILATGSFSLTEGKRGTVVLHLTAAGRKWFAHASMRHLIAAKLTLSVQTGKTATRSVLVG
jgi:PKD domain